MDFSQKVIFSTERCNIRLFQDKDMASLLEYRNDMEWMKFQGFKGLSESEYKKTLLKGADITKGMQLAIVDKVADELIGDLYVLGDKENFWLGYTIARKHSRKGYAYEVVSNLIKWIQENGDYNILAGVSEENTASVNLLRKLGFTYSHIEDGDHIYRYPDDFQG